MKKEMDFTKLKSKEWLYIASKIKKERSLPFLANNLKFLFIGLESETCKNYVSFRSIVKAHLAIFFRLRECDNFTSTANR